MSFIPLFVTNKRNDPRDKPVAFAKTVKSQSER